MSSICTQNFKSKFASLKIELLILSIPLNTIEIPLNTIENGSGVEF